MGCHTHSSRHRVGRPSAPWQRRGWAGKLRPPDEEGALLSTETPHRPEPRQEGASPGPGTEATATAIPRGPHPQQVAACQSSLPPPGLPQGPEPEPQGRVAVWGAGVSGSPHLSAMSCPLSVPKAWAASVSLQVFICGGHLGKATRTTQNGHPGPPSVVRSQQSQASWPQENQSPFVGGREVSGRSQAPAQPAGEAGCGAGGSGTAPRHTTTLQDSGELLTVCSWPRRYWEPGEEQRGTGVGTQAAPPPTYQCPPLSGRSWPLLPLGEKALFSLAATDGACGWRTLGH